MSKVEVNQSRVNGQGSKVENQERNQKQGTRNKEPGTVFYGLDCNSDWLDYNQIQSQLHFFKRCGNSALAKHFARDRATIATKIKPFLFLALFFAR